jgi:hypothetical protein
MICELCRLPARKAQPHDDPAACVEALRARLRKLRIQRWQLKYQLREARRWSDEHFREMRDAYDYVRESLGALKGARGDELLGRMPVDWDAEPYERVRVGILYLRARVAELEAARRVEDPKGR